MLLLHAITSTETPLAALGPGTAPDAPPGAGHGPGGERPGGDRRRGDRPVAVCLAAGPVGDDAGRRAARAGAADLRGDGPAEHTGAVGAGLRGFALRRVECGSLVAWATVWHAAEPTPLDRADLLANHVLLTRLGDCLPARFPTWLSDEPSLREQLARHAVEFDAALARLRGTCELALTAVWAEPPTPPGSAAPRAAGPERAREAAAPEPASGNETATGEAPAERPGAVASAGLERAAAEQAEDAPVSAPHQAEDARAGPPRGREEAPAGALLGAETPRMSVAHRAVDPQASVAGRGEETRAGAACGGVAAAAAVQRRRAGEAAGGGQAVEAVSAETRDGVGSGDAGERAGSGRGRQYLLERQRTLASADRRRARAAELRALIEAACGPELVAAEQRVCPSPDLALSSALLVRRAHAPAVRRRLEAALRTQADVRILVNGPWPPYTFVGQPGQA